MSYSSKKESVVDKIVEICCGSYEDALMAYQGGAKRIELNSALFLGGLTPTISSLLLIKKHTDLEVVAMARPRGGGFCYSTADFESMVLDAELLLQHGADGIAFGCLEKTRRIDKVQTKEMLSVIKQNKGYGVFHRAFDCVDDPYGAMEELIELGVKRVLTSGLRAKAIDGVDLIADLQKKFGAHIELLAGSGVNVGNARLIMEKTGIHQVHSSCKSWITDETTIGKYVSYSYAGSPHEKDYETVSAKLVKNLLESVR